MTVLYAAHRAVERITLDRDLMHSATGSRRSGQDGLLRFLVSRQDGRPDGLHPRGPTAGHRRGALEALQGASSSRAAPAPTASTTKASPPWKAAGPMIRPTPRASCESKVSPAASRPGSVRGRCEKEHADGIRRVPALRDFRKIVCRERGLSVGNALRGVPRSGTNIHSPSGTPERAFPTRGPILFVKTRQRP